MLMLSLLSTPIADLFLTRPFLSLEFPSAHVSITLTVHLQILLFGKGKMTVSKVFSFLHIHLRTYLEAYPSSDCFTFF